MSALPVAAKAMRRAALGAWLGAPPRLRWHARYGTALVAASAAVAATVAGAEVLQPTTFVLPLAAVALTAWLGGLGPGLLATVTSAALTWLFVFAPEAALPVTRPGGDAIRTTLFILVGALISGLAESLRSTVQTAAIATAEASRNAAAFREQRLQTELVLRHASDGITVQGPDGRLIYANDAAARMMGFPSAEDLAGASATEILARFEIMDEAGEPLAADALPGRVAIRERVEAERLIRYRRRGAAEEKWSLVRATPALDEAGSVLFAVNVFHDLTDRITYERDLEAASRAKSQFLAVMSHELRTPLNAIMGYQELLQHEVVGPMNPTQREQLGRIGTSARHLLELIEQVLTLSRIEAGKEELRTDRVVVAELVAGVAALMDPLARQKALDLAVHVDPAAPTVLRTDAFRVRQILLNLVSNAIKFTESGGVRIEVDPAEGVAITVRDTGRGIPADELGRVFEPFFQGSGDGAGRSAGTGLGLAVARQLAEMLGGSLTAESRVGLGSAFRLTLPAEPPSA